MKPRSHIFGLAVEGRHPPSMHLSGMVLVIELSSSSKYCRERVGVQHVLVNKNTRNPNKQNTKNLRIYVSCNALFHKHCLFTSKVHKPPKNTSGRAVLEGLGRQESTPVPLDRATQHRVFFAAMASGFASRVEICSNLFNMLLRSTTFCRGEGRGPTKNVSDILSRGAW